MRNRSPAGILPFQTGESKGRGGKILFKNPYAEVFKPQAQFPFISDSSSTFADDVLFSL